MGFYCPTCESAGQPLRVSVENFGGRTEFKCANDPAHAVRLFPVERMGELARKVHEVAISDLYCENPLGSLRDRSMDRVPDRQDVMPDEAA